MAWYKRSFFQDTRMIFMGKLMVSGFDVPLNQSIGSDVPRIFKGFSNLQVFPMWHSPTPEPGDWARRHLHLRGGAAEQWSHVTGRSNYPKVVLFPMGVSIVDHSGSDMVINGWLMVSGWFMVSGFHGWFEDFQLVMGPQNGWMLSFTENPNLKISKMDDDWGYPHDSGNLQMNELWLGLDPAPFKIGGCTSSKKFFATKNRGSKTGGGHIWLDIGFTIKQVHTTDIYWQKWYHQQEGD